MEDALFGLREGKWQLSLVSLRFLLLALLPHGHRNALEQVRETFISSSHWLGISHLPIIQCLHWNYAKPPFDPLFAYVGSISIAGTTRGSA